ncbi:MAG: xylann 1,4-beta-xylosidase [Eubacteriales bacterium]|nr:xylann 1,4-beta-xylosidase [Eubacteriales bacterium]
MRTLHINLNGTRKPMDRFFDHCVGAGRAGEMLRAQSLTQLSMLQEGCHFRYLRFHGLLSDDMAVCRLDGDGKVLYNWQYIDLVFDEMLARGIRPLVELSFMPDCLKSGDTTIFWWKGNVTPPADMERWSGLVSAVARHVTARYGVTEVERWYFEVWNEPNLSGFFTGTQADYFALYDATVAAIKAVHPAYRVGGPATAGLDEGAWIPEMIAHCAENNVPIDFISTHSYGGDGALDEYGRDRHRLKAAPDCVMRDVRNVRRQVLESALPDLPVFFTEWSNSYTPRDNVHDSYISAPFVLYTLKRCEGYADSMSYWTFTDIFEEAGPGPAPFHGGFGLMNIQGIKKPTFHAFRWLCELPDTELPTEDTDSYAAVDDTAVHVLFWNYTKPEQDAVNESYFIRDLPAKAIEDVHVTLEGLTRGTYTVEHYRVGYLKKDAYTLYLRAGLTALDGWETPSAAQMEALRRQTDGAPEALEKLCVGADGRATLAVPMRENDVVRLILRHEGA